MHESLHLPEDLRQRIVDHCLEALPNEGCGLIASDQQGRVTEVYLTSNSEASPTGYTVPPEEHFAALGDAESKGWELSGVFHSHPDGTARPSLTDVMTANDPTWVYLVVGLRSTPTIRAWRIRDKNVAEVELT